MAHQLVKISRDDNGEEIDSPKWCLSVAHAGTTEAFCSGQVYGYGESAAEYKAKSCQRGGITCPNCLARIKQIKSIRL